MSKDKSESENFKTPQVNPSHYFSPEYNTRGRFAVYWNQINEIRKLCDGGVLEVGPGNKFVADYLQKRDVSVKTMDIDPDLNVDIIGSVTDIPCNENAFSVAACFEVLEHMPYEQALAGLQELTRVARDYVVFSVPDYEHAIWGKIRIPIIGKVEWFIPLERPIPYEEPRVKDQHYWEIGMKNYSFRYVKKDLKNIGLDIVRSYRIREKDDNRFFVINV
jgi:hypothetical protein